MSQERFAAVDRYVVDLLLPADPALDAALEASAAAGLPRHHVSPPQGRLLELLARMRGARRILEIGTLAGYSTICLARALGPDGRLATLEREPAYAEVARANLARAGLAAVAEVRVGPALETLPRLAAEDGGPFDLVFIDADKERTPEYLGWALELTAPGSAIVADNVVRGGALADASSDDALVRGVRRFHELVAAEPRLRATTIQTVGTKGYDGFTPRHRVTSARGSDRSVGVRTR
jgi:predicted O-methyltransferase YrrM